MCRKYLRSPLRVIIAGMAALLLCGCAAFIDRRQEHRAASAVDYLYPDASQAPQLLAATTTLRPPIRVGIAFVPGGQWNAGISEQARARLLERVKASFAQYPYIGSIEVIPSNYLRARGGFDNLDQVARLFNVEVVALLSYDQVQFDDSSALSVLYWTIVGAYVIRGDRYDVQTLIDAAVFDVASRKLLFRAPGTSRVKGAGTMASFSERSRNAQAEGYAKAVDDLIPRLHDALADFRERMRADATVKVENRTGYQGGGDLGGAGLLFTFALAGLAYANRRRV
jgi:rhombotail lipoprotein